MACDVFIKKMASFVPSQRGVFKLHYEGFIYVKQSETQLKTHWRCEKYRKCRGRASSINENIIITADHNHDPDYHMCEVATVLANIKAQSMNSQDPPKNIVSKALTGLSEAALVKIPKIVSLKKAAARAKKRAAETPQDKAFRLLIAGKHPPKCKRPVKPIEQETYIIISQQDGRIDIQKKNSKVHISTKIPVIKQEDPDEDFSGTLSSIEGIEETSTIPTVDGKFSITRKLSNDDEREKAETDDNLHYTQKISDRVGRDEYLVYGESIANRFYKSNRSKAEIDVAMKLIDGIMFNLTTGIYSCLSFPATNEAGERERGPSLSTPAFSSAVSP